MYDTEMEHFREFAKVRLKRSGHGDKGENYLIRKAIKKTAYFKTLIVLIRDLMI